MKTRFVTDINKIKYEVNMEVARMAFNGELDEHREEIAYNIIREIRRSTAAVFIRSGRSSVRESAWQKAIRRCREAILKTLFRYFRPPAKAVRSTGSVLRTTVRCVWLKNVCPPAISERSPLKAAGPTSTRKNVRSAESVWKPVRTMPLPI